MVLLSKMMLKRIFSQILICSITLFSFTKASIGKPDQLYTSSVAYCSPPIAILVTDLSLHFYPQNSTLEFDLSAASIQDNLNVSIALSVNAYGLGLFNVNIDLCSLAGGILCPLPKYQFSGGGIFPVPEQFSNQIPEIAYKIPDLEAVATLQLSDTSSGSNNNVVGCVQATLSNGHTAKQSGVLWATVGLALLAFFSSLLHTVIAQSVGAAQWRIVDVMWAIQHPAITSLLSLNYPTVFLSYGTNFAWSLGLINIPSLQSSITQTRSNTGGHDQAVFGKNLTAESGRKFNPFNGEGESQSSGSSSGLGKSLSIGSLGFFKAKNEISNNLSNFVQSKSSSILQPFSSHAQIYDPENGSLLKRQQYAPNTGPGGSLITGGQGVSLPLVTGDNRTVNGGIGTFAERNYVAPSNAFLTVLVSMMILLAICVAALILTYLIAFIVRLLTDKRNKGKGLTRNLSHWSHRVTKPSEFFNTVILPTLGRYLLIIFPIFFIFAFWQWVDGDSWVGHLVAALMTVIILAFTSIIFIPMIVHARKSNPSTLYHNQAPAHGTKTAKRWGHLSHPYRQRFYWFSLALLLFAFIRACFISFAQQHGTRQSIGLLVTDVLVFLILCIFRVGRDKKSDFVLILLCFSRIAAWAVCVVFIPSANVRTIPRAIVAFVLLVVTALPIIYLFFLTVYDLFMPLLRRNRIDVSHKDEMYEKNRQNDLENRRIGLEHSHDSEDIPDEQSQNAPTARSTIDERQERFTS